MATPAIGSSLLASASRRITAPSIGMACASVMVRNRWARINSSTAITTPAATAMIAQAILFPVIASIIQLFDTNVEGDGLYRSPKRATGSHGDTPARRKALRTTAALASEG